MQIIQFLNRVDVHGIVGRTNIERIGDKKCLTMSVVTEYAHIDENGEACVELTWFMVRAFEGPDTQDIEFIQKGSFVAVTGRFMSKRYTDANGNEKNTYEIYASKVKKANGIIGDDIKAIPEKPSIRKTLFFFFGSLSVLQILENNGINKLLSPGMSRDTALYIANKLIRQSLGDNQYDYDLELNTVEYEEDSEEKIQERFGLDIRSCVEAYGLNEKSLEESNGSGNSQGWTAFLISVRKQPSPVNEIPDHLKNKTSFQYLGKTFIGAGTFQQNGLKDNFKEIIRRTEWNPQKPYIPDFNHEQFYALAKTVSQDKEDIFWCVELGFYLVPSDTFMYKFNLEFPKYRVENA